jgi:hypothetical protein
VLISNIDGESLVQNDLATRLKRLAIDLSLRVKLNQIVDIMGAAGGADVSKVCQMLYPELDLKKKRLDALKSLVNMLNKRAEAQGIPVYMRMSDDLTRIWLEETEQQAKTSGIFSVFQWRKLIVALFVFLKRSFS